MELFLKVWDQALLNLEEYLSVYVRKTWIREMKPFKREENDYIFSVEFEMQKRMIDDRFLDQIKAAMEEAHEEITGVRNGHINPVIILDIQTNDLKEDKKEEEKKETKEKHTSVIPLDPKYTFDTYVVGECNSFAARAARKIAENPGKIYNPLFLYGGPSLGKSHLLHAIGNHILEENSACW